MTDTPATDAQEDVIDLDALLAADRETNMGLRTFRYMGEVFHAHKKANAFLLLKFTAEGEKGMFPLLLSFVVEEERERFQEAFERDAELGGDGLTTLVGFFMSQQTGRPTASR